MAGENDQAADAADKSGVDIAKDDAAALLPNTGDDASKDNAGDDNKAKDDAGKGDDKAGEGAPEKYEDLKTPEGFQVDKEAVAEFLADAKELNLSQANAQKLFDKYVANTQKVTDGVAKAWEKQVDDWLTEAKDDAEVGGAKFDENVGYANKVLEWLGDAQLKADLTTTGVGNKLTFIRAFSKIGRAMSEAKLHLGGSTTDAQPTNAAEDLFPSMTKKE